MEKLTLTTSNIDIAIKRCREVLSSGGVVLLPTETVYGLVCKYDLVSAVEKIYQLKKREKSKLLAIFTSDYKKILPYGLIDNPLIEELASCYCPGKITIIGKAKDEKTIGFRIPEHAFVLKLLNELDFVLASTSANISGEPNILSVDEALTALNGDVDLVIDGGIIDKNSLASTVVDATDGQKAKILRQGELVINPKFL